MHVGTLLAEGQATGSMDPLSKDKRRRALPFMRLTNKSAEVTVCDYDPTQTPLARLSKLNSQLICRGCQVWKWVLKTLQTRNEPVLT